MENNIYCFWTGKNKMSESRKDCLHQLKKVSQCNIILVDIDNLNQYILHNEPLHESYKYLSETHKADYLRTYFMRFYGGGYSDIKRTNGPWIDSFKNLYNSDKWIIGYQEDMHGVAYPPLKDKWEYLIGNCAYICKPNTPLVIEWYNTMISLMDEKLVELKKYPATHPQDAKENYQNGGYPIGWNEMLGRIFHKIIYKYTDKCLFTLPCSSFYNYR